MSGRLIVLVLEYVGLVSAFSFLLCLLYCALKSLMLTGRVIFTVCMDRYGEHIVEIPLITLSIMVTLKLATNKAKQILTKLLKKNNKQ